MPLSFVTLDVFTSTPFRGNPVAIVHVPLTTDLSQEQKQLIAREFFLSETVFLHGQTADDIEARQARIDIFTPYAEVPFAGHPTIGTSNYLAHHLHLGSVHTLVTKAGPLPFQELGDGAQLAVAHNVHIHDRPFAGRAGLGHYPVVSIVNGMTAILARLPDVDALAEPTKNLLGTENTYTACDALDEGWRAGPVVSYFYVDLGVGADGTKQVRTRNLGSREDPATGSAASRLCAFLSLVEKEGPLTRKYEVVQGVEMGRESHIYVQVTANEARDGIEEILLSGTAVKVTEGKIEIPQV
ncbi:Diaminopimelate epimerase-like protein [Xylariomycetidae sp. FL2044]|nr:Diaminopimelate epimerase-like protein [Xylariomycetidae sp. FL2044]